MFTIQGYLLSIVYLLICFRLITEIHCGEFSKRKILHFLMACWWLIRLFWKTTMIIACSGPFLFVFINWYFTKRKRTVTDHGLIYFAISLTGLTAFSFYSKENLWCATLAIIILGVGDPLAAVIGKRYGKKKIRNKKTYLGTTVFLISTIIASFCVSRFFQENDLLKILIICMSAAIAELIAEEGLDNLFIPIVVIVVYLSYDSKMLLNFAVCHMILAVIVSSKKLLTPKGVLGAYCIGSLAGLFGQMQGIIALYVFFLIAIAEEILLSHIKKSKKEILEQRNCFQILANSIVAMFVLSCYWRSKDTLYLYVYYVAFSECLSDTTASCFGKFWGKRTISITTLQPIQKGLSGGISLPGCIFGAIAAVILPFFVLIDKKVLLNPKVLMLCGIIGFVGMLIDSVLGDLLQAKYRCNTCGKITENRCCCKAKGTLIHGIAWVDNNVVNLLSTVITVVLGYTILTSMKLFLLINV